MPTGTRSLGLEHGDDVTDRAALWHVTLECQDLVEELGQSALVQEGLKKE